jgi:hypothetical protein
MIAGSIAAAAKGGRMTEQPIYHLITDEEIEQIQNGDLTTLKTIQHRPDVMDLIDGRLEGLKILLATPDDKKTMSNAELNYAIDEVQIIRDCLDVEP